MQQESQYQDQQPRITPSTCESQQYTTHISELISQPAVNNVYLGAAEYILSSLYQLSSYLFTKKVQQNSIQNSLQLNQSQLNFNSYLQLMQQDLGKFQKIRTLKRTGISMEKLSMESELVKCYQKVEGIYFEENYVLDLSYFQYFYVELKNKQKKGKNSSVNSQIQKLCQSLDLVQINLFSQIHCKFQQYFKVVANFEYLKQSVTLHLQKLKKSRKAIHDVKSNFIDKSVILRKKILQRQNIQKLLKLIKQIKSIKKLPQVLQSILASSLPYQSFSLLQDTKGTLQSLKSLKCLKNTSQSVKNMQSLVQKDLNKRYATQLYQYLQQCHNKDSGALQQLWQKIQVHTCLDKDSSFVLDQLNSSTNSALSDNPQLLQQLELMNFGSDPTITNSALVPRHQGKQYQITMILLQSYKYVSFSPQFTKIKVCNALRVFTKRFEKQLLVYLNRVVSNEIEQIKQKGKQAQVTQEMIENEKPLIMEQKRLSQENQNASVDVVQKVSVEFYTKHLGVLNQIFKDTVTRFMGYLFTLITQYEQQFSNEWKNCSENDYSKLQQSHKKFKDILQQQSSLLPSIFKIIQQKIKHLLTLKNISNIDCLQFYRWITTLRYWQRYLDHIIQFDPLLSHQPYGPARQPVQELISIVRENIKKSMQAMGLQSLLYETTVDYINVYHNNTANNEVINTLQQDTWQSTEIPAQFGDILQSIFNPDGNALNSSVTILDSSTNSSKGILNVSRQKNDKFSQQPSTVRGIKTKIKLLKNNILISGVRYKVNLSFLILCESLGEHMKLSRVLSNVEKGANQNQNKITAYVYQKAYNLIQIYCKKSKELIIDTKALSYGKIKAKTINAKHICLLSNCLSVVQKITQEMLEAQKIQTLKLVQQRQKAIALLVDTRENLISKLTSILLNKTEKQINDFLQQEKLNPQQPQATSKTSSALISSFLQMVQITDEYLQAQGVRQVLKSSFQALSQKYLTHLLLKGGKQKAQVQLLIQRLKFLRKYFPAEYQTLLKQIPA